MPGLTDALEWRNGSSERNGYSPQLPVSSEAPHQFFQLFQFFSGSLNRTSLSPAVDFTRSR
jgi:hypothetical protein